MSRIRIDDIEVSKIHKEAESLAKAHFRSAEILANNDSYPAAYNLLVLAIEEAAKARICMFYDNFKDDSSTIDGKGIPFQQHILPNHVESMFGEHKRKHDIIMVQEVFELLNTSDKALKKRVNEAIKNCDVSNAPELEALLKVFKPMHKNRLDACYTSEKGDKLKDFKKEYVALLPYARSCLGRINSFAVRKFVDYSTTEQEIKKLLDQI